jgi:hypothetical protein
MYSSIPLCLPNLVSARPSQAGSKIGHRVELQAVLLVDLFFSSGSSFFSGFVTHA